MRVHYLVVPVEVGDDVTREHAAESLEYLIENGLETCKDPDAQPEPGEEDPAEMAKLRVVLRSNWRNPV